jgi:hypothetical protein
MIADKTGAGAGHAARRGAGMLPLEFPRDFTRSMLAGRCRTQKGHQRDAASQCGEHRPVQHPSHRVAINRIAHTEAIAVRLQKSCMG